VSQKERLPVPDLMPTTVRVTLQIDPLISNRIDQSESLRVGATKSIERLLADIMACLGIPGDLAVEMISLADPLPHDSFMRVDVEGERCRFPDELVERVLSYVRATPLAMPANRAGMLERIGALAESESNAGQQLTEFLSLICAEIVKQRPATLFGVRQAEAYCANLVAPRDPPGHWPPDPAWVRTVLAPVLNLRISIGDRRAVADVLAAAGDRTDPEVVEELIAVLQPDVLEIRMRRDDLRQMTTAANPLRGELFTFVREALFSELGVRYPRFRFASSPDMKPGSFTFLVNHLPLLPWMGLEPEQCLVNDTADRVRLLNMSAENVMNPVSGMPGSLISASAKAQAESHGLTTWEQPDFLILCLGSVLREYAACLLRREMVQEQMEQIGYPALVNASRTTFSVEQLMQILRELVLQGIPMNNFRLILELLVDWDHRTSPTAFVRAGLKRQISHKRARGMGTLVAYLLDPRFDAMLARPDVTESEHDRFVEALKAEMDSLPPTAAVPVLLTTGPARALSSKVLATALPRLVAVSYDELATGLNVQPVARIAWSEAS
jgi:hypothetical protein